MKLSGDTIRKLILENGLVRDEKTTVFSKEKGKAMPYLEYVLSNVGPNNLDVRVGHQFFELKRSSTGFIDLHSKPDYEQLTCDRDGAYFIQPGQFCLATTMEYIKLPRNICATIDSRSSIGRRGLVTQTATNIQAGFEGTLTLELKNEAPVPIKIFPGDIVSQIIFEYLDTETSTPYNGAYQGQDTTRTPD